MSSSVMVWSVESVILGLWALVLASYSTPLHTFVARCHVLISAFTTVLHLYVKARNLVVGSAVSQAFVCAVSALFLGYLAVLFASDSQSNPLYFSAPSVGPITLDACAGLAWFAVAFINSIGMALSSIERVQNKKNEANTAATTATTTTTKRTTTTFLMFHPYGFHLVAVLPSLVLIYVSGFTRISAMVIDLSTLDSLYIIICIVTWIVYIICSMILIFVARSSRRQYGRSVSGSNYYPGNNNSVQQLTPSPQQQQPSAFMQNVNAFMSIFTGVYLIVVTFLAMVASSLSIQQRILAISLLVVSVLVSIPSLGMISKLPIIGPIFPKTGALDSFFSVDGIEEYEGGSYNSIYPRQTPSSLPLQPNEFIPTAPQMMMPSIPPVHITPIAPTSRFVPSASHQQRIPRLSFASNANTAASISATTTTPTHPIDPAAVSLNFRPSNPGENGRVSSSSYSREKMV